MASNDRRQWPGRFRRVVQTACFVLFVLYILYAPVLTVRSLIANGVMGWSPLAGVGSMISAWTFVWAFIPAFVLLLGAVFLGRYFCGWMCPLGATIDIVDWGFDKAGLGPHARNDRVGKGADARYSFERSAYRRLKYYVLIVCFVAAVFGLSLFGYVDPLSIVTRSYVLVVQPYFLRVVLSITVFFGHIPIIGDLFSSMGDILRTGLQGGSNMVFMLQVVTAVSFATVLGLSLLGKRMWCRSVCPLGALYALVGLQSYTGRKVSDFDHRPTHKYRACIECGRCADVCPMECISQDGHQTLAGECILCMRCQEVCPVDAVRFLGSSREQIKEVDLTRRGTVAALGTAVVAYPLFKSTASGTSTKGGTFVRPPLAGRDREKFLQECLRCGQCMRVCPTQAIQPAGLQGGLESVWTPQLVPRQGYCVYNCDRCGQICPTDAIPNFTLDEKHSTAMGLAYVDRTRCIPWRGWQYQQEEDVDWDQHNCGVCEEVCPVPGKAIHFRRHDMGEGQELRVPYVRSEVCVGCGFCENVCPVQGQAAIRVTGGYREVEQASEESEPMERIRSAFPATAGDWRMTGEPTVRTTEDELFSWINGAAEPYLKFQFTSAANALYVHDDAKAEIVIWQFKHPDDAFGVYSKFRPADGEEQDFGDRVSVAEGPVLWGWEGLWYIRVQPLAGDVSKEDVRVLGKKVVERLDAEDAHIPEICRMLPTSGRKTGTMRFMRHELHMEDLYLPMAVNEAIQFEGGTVGAFCEYEQGKSGMETGLLLIEYPTPGDAKDALVAYTDKQEEMDISGREEQGVTFFKMGTDNYSAADKENRLLAISLGWARAEDAVNIVREVVGQ